MHCQEHKPRIQRMLNGRLGLISHRKNCSIDHSIVVKSIDLFQSHKSGDSSGGRTKTQFNTPPISRIVVTLITAGLKTNQPRNFEHDAIFQNFIT